ncbi:hypothetical protein M422DRAFT_212081 [Sphaerobolus stellatus SS14]|uniref:Ketoreductase domain-containing protein n=1 Tax=Sphaerobolus stellatus (strain SS14) TaxID=990650 RepID=A0A0C9U1U4_SPHS4|nr:hypothetical protein M422DRAFT_212081 [Sphaerobolus stellatus SS14]
MASSVAGKVAIVTGAARDIGRAISLRLAKEGLNVVVSDLLQRSSELDEVVRQIHGETQAEAVSHIADVSKEEDVVNIVSAAVKTFGGLMWCMVTNAGICPSSRFIDTSVEEWDRVFAMKARGVFLCYREAAKQMLQQGRGGRIIGASSSSGKRGYPEFGAYSASKFAVRGITQVASDELWDRGITVNAYAPSAVATPILFDMTTDRQDKGLPSLSGSGDGANKIIQPDDIAGIVAYLIKDEARFTTGECSLFIYL